MASMNSRSRELLRWGGLVLATAMLAFIATAQTPEPKEQLDHVILGVSDLGRGMSQFEALTGVRPTAGGVHPGRGTHNALVSLGSGQYLEIMAPVGDEQPASPFQLLSTLQHITPIAWVVSTQDMGHTVETLEARGVATGEPMPGSRKRPDGRVLKWTLVPIEAPFETNIPALALIQWSEGSVHPSVDSAPGCRLVSLEVAGSTAILNPIVEALGLRVAIAEADSPKLRLALDCGGDRISLPRADAEGR